MFPRTKVYNKKSPEARFEAILSYNHTILTLSKKILKHFEPFRGFSRTSSTDNDVKIYFFAAPLFRGTPN